MNKNKIKENMLVMSGFKKNEDDDWENERGNKIDGDEEFYITFARIVYFAKLEGMELGEKVGLGEYFLRRDLYRLFECHDFRRKNGK